MSDTTPSTRVHRFDNGLVLVSEQVSGVQSLAMRCIIPAGAVFEDIHNLGASSVCAEMLMRGAGDLDSRQQADAFDRAGALRDVDNAIRFMQLSTTTLGHRAGDAIPLLMDMIRRPRMAQESFAPAQELALLGVASLEDDPQHRAALRARERHLPSPYNRNTFGTQEGIASITHEKLCAWWDGLALPGGTLISAAGDVHHEQLVEQIGQQITGWTGETAMPKPEGTPERGYGHLDDDSNQVQIMIVHDAPTISHADNPLERLAIAVLSGGMSGRLFTEVREKRGLCYAVSSAYRADKDRGVVTNYVGTTPERAQESLDVLHAELHRINSGDVSDAELTRAKTGLKSRLVFAGESTKARAGAIAADYFNLGRVRTLDEIVEQLDAISLDDLNDYLRRRDLGAMTIQTLGPDPLTPPA
ncbi:MAG: M16 family metallopeptidase [Phycisphaerales bacterium]